MGRRQLDQPASVEIAKHTLMSGGLILAVGTAAGLFALKAKIPDVAIFLLAGMLIGPQALGLIDIKADSALYQILLLFGASYILFDGGASLRFHVMKQVWITIVVIATVGVLITAIITSTAAHFVLGVPWIVAALLGATLASTDPATLVPIFRQVHVRDRVAQMVMCESAFNDATGAIVTFGVLTVAMGTGEFSLSSSVLDLITQAALGIAAGAVLGYLAADGMRASGFMAVFVFGIMLGNKDSFGFKMGETEARRLDQYVETTAFIMRLFIFILLGSQVDFGLMNRYLLGGVAVVAIFMLVARPVTVFACALPDRRARWSLNEMLFMCWTRETGVIPAALAGILLGMKAPGAQVIASVTFIAILMTILIQAPTTRWLGGRLALLEEKKKG